MATSKVLKVCPSCQGELSVPPPKHCPMCRSDAAWKLYIDKEVTTNNGKKLRKLMYTNPLTVYEQLLAKAAQLETRSSEVKAIDSIEARDHYERMFVFLEDKVKKAILMDALMVLKTLTASDHSSEEVAGILTLATKIGPLAESLQKTLSLGIILKKGIDYESNE